MNALRPRRARPRRRNRCNSTHLRVCCGDQESRFGAGRTLGKAIDRQGFAWSSARNIAFPLINSSICHKYGATNMVRPNGIVNHKLRGPLGSPRRRTRRSRPATTGPSSLPHNSLHSSRSTDHPTSWQRARVALRDSKSEPNLTSTCSKDRNRNGRHELAACQVFLQTVAPHSPFLQCIYRIH